MTKTYRYGSIMRQLDDDPASEEMVEGTIYVKAGDQSDGTSRTVISQETEGFVDIESECVKVYEGDGLMSEREAERLAINRAKEEDLMSKIEHA